MNLKLFISTQSGKSTLTNADTGDVLDGVIACQLSGGDNGFAPLVHLTLANVEIVREPPQPPPVAQAESPFMGRDA